MHINIWLCIKFVKTLNPVDMYLERSQRLSNIIFSPSDENHSHSLVLLQVIYYFPKTHYPPPYSTIL